MNWYTKRKPDRKFAKYSRLTSSQRGLAFTLDLKQLLADFLITGHHLTIVEVQEEEQEVDSDVST